MSIPTRWVSLTTVDAVPEGKAVLVKHGRRDLLIFHTAGQWTAYDNTCPNAGAPIFAEHFDGECVTCTYHGLRFRARDGACPDASGWELEPFPVKVDGNEVLVGFPDL